nr:glycine receptor subunit alpha-3-like [Penaeus vannamei]
MRNYDNLAQSSRYDLNRFDNTCLSRQVRQVEMHDSKGDGDRSGKTVTITLDNLYMYYVSSTYIPTFLLIFIGMLTFFFPLDDFNDRIMVSLTSLLVLAALFTQVSASIPKTSYLKLVDVWFIFCICIVFSVVATLTAINYFKRSPKVSPLVVVKPAMQPTTDNKITNASISAINRLCQLTFPVIALLFTANALAHTQQG